MLIITINVLVSEPGGQGAIPLPRPGPIKISHNEDGHIDFIFLVPPPTRPLDPLLSVRSMRLSNWKMNRSQYFGVCDLLISISAYLR